MSNRTTLRRLEQLAQHQLAQQDEAEQRERERWEAMTDEDLALRLEALERLVTFIREYAPDFAAELDMTYDHSPAT